MNSNLTSNEQRFEINSKSQLNKILRQIFNDKMKVRLLSNSADSRNNGHKFALVEELSDGKTRFLVGAPTLSLLADFTLVALKENRF
jgi:hypothetical protein